MYQGDYEGAEKGSGQQPAASEPEYFTHQGRDSFRRCSGRDLVKDFEDMDWDEIRRQQFAMRSFTQSIEMDNLPPGLEVSSGASPSPPLGDRQQHHLAGYEGWDRVSPPESSPFATNNEEISSRGRNDGEKMARIASSSTVDTIIEVLQPASSSTEQRPSTPSPEQPGDTSTPIIKPLQLDPNLGETQKYVITVPGPGHHDQEMDLHKSLLVHEALGGSEEEPSNSRPHPLRDDPNPSSATPTTAHPNYSVREKFSQMALERPRPTTPTSWSTIESFVFDEQLHHGGPTIIAGDKRPSVSVKERLPPDSGARIRVSLPGHHRTSSQRRMREEGGAGERFRPRRQSSQSWCDFYKSIEGDRSDADIVEMSAAGSQWQVPPQPVMHRRSSVDWEAFRERCDDAIQKDGPTGSQQAPTTTDEHASSSAIDSNQHPFPELTEFDSRLLANSQAGKDNNKDEHHTNGAENMSTHRGSTPPLSPIVGISNPFTTPGTTTPASTSASSAAENPGQQQRRTSKSSRKSSVHQEEFNSIPKLSKQMSKPLIGNSYGDSVVIAPLPNLSSSIPVRAAPPPPGRMPPATTTTTTTTTAAFEMAGYDAAASGYAYDPTTAYYQQPQQPETYDPSSYGYEYSSSAYNPTTVPIDSNPFGGGDDGAGRGGEYYSQKDYGAAAIQQYGYDASQYAGPPYGGGDQAYGYGTEQYAPPPTYGSDQAWGGGGTGTVGAYSEGDYYSAQQQRESQPGQYGYGPPSTAYYPTQQQYPIAPSAGLVRQSTLPRQPTLQGSTPGSPPAVRKPTLPRQPTLVRQPTCGEDFSTSSYIAAPVVDPYAQFGSAPGGAEDYSYAHQQQYGQEAYPVAATSGPYDPYGGSTTYQAYDEASNPYTAAVAPNFTYESYDAYGMPAESGSSVLPYEAELPLANSSEPDHFIPPLLPPQRSRTPDPFSWEVQENALKKTGEPLVPTPPRPPPLAVTPQPGSSPTESSPREGEKSRMDKVEEEAPKKAPPPRPAAPPPARPPAPMSSPSRPPQPSSTSRKGEQEQPQSTAAASKEEGEEEDAWARFKQMTEKVTSAVQSTTEQLKSLSERSAADEIHDESYLSQVGGSQGFELTSGQLQMLHMKEEKKKEKADKKAEKRRGKKPPSPTLDPKRDEDIEKAARELVKQMAATRVELADWKAPQERETRSSVSGEHPPAKEETPTPTFKKSSPSTEEATPQSGTLPQQQPRSAEEEAKYTNWADFNGGAGPVLQSSESDFFSKNFEGQVDAYGRGAFGNGLEYEEGETPRPPLDPFAPIKIEEDPFATRPIEEIIAEARRKAELEAARLVEEDEEEVIGVGRPTPNNRLRSGVSSPTPEGGSPASSARRPAGFEDDFRDAERGDWSHTPTPLYDEDDSLPLPEFPAKFHGDGWSMFIRYPPKKKLMADRYWRPCYVRIDGSTVFIFEKREEPRAFQEILLQSSYSLSDVSLQPFDAYGKVHTVKLQHVLYKERVGIRPGQISRLVEGHVTKYGLPLEHAAQCQVLAKFASHSQDDLTAFINCVEDLLFHCAAKRDTVPLYKQDEVQIHCYDEYTANVDKDGVVSDQRARVRLFCLAFLTGTPHLEIGLNDRRRQGKEIVRRKDILPMYTERWIRFEGLEFHNTIDRATWEEEQVVKLTPPDGCFFEVMRFRVRPPKNRDKPLSVKAVMRMAGSSIEIRVHAMAAAQQQRARGTMESTRMIPSEDIQIRFPLPEAWIYIFREERHWGVGSVHSKQRKPGRVKNLRDKLMGTVQQTEQTLIEVSTGEAKYEHLFRSLVWRIPRLPESNKDAYKSNMLKCRFDLSSFDLMPEEFLPKCQVEFTMPLATISHTVVRSVSVEQHEDSDRVEKFVRYVAKCHYNVDIDYVQCDKIEDDNDGGFAVTAPGEQVEGEKEHPHHVPTFAPDAEECHHMGYGIELPDDNPTPRPPRHDSSSSDEEEDSKARKFPMVEINMKGYGAGEQ